MAEAPFIRATLATAQADSAVFVPPEAVWRVRVTDDIARDVHESGVEFASAFTVARGVNVAAGFTVLHPDRSAEVLLSSPSWTGLPSAADQASRVRYLTMHEAGHVGLAARGEDTRSVLPLVRFLDPIEQSWARPMGFALEDYRIDRVLGSIAPTLHPWSGRIGRDLAVYENARERVPHAAYEVAVALAYLAAETFDPRAHLDRVDRERWDRLVAPTWDDWTAALALAEPATIPMMPEAVAHVVEGLSIVAARMSAAGATL